MRFSYILPALSALAAFVSAQTAGGPNSFMIPMSGGYTLTASQPTTFTWDNLSGSTVTLKLRSGPSGNLNEGTTIVAGLSNTGTYTYTPPADTPAGTTYTIEIINDQDPTQVNYTPQFPIISSVTATPSASTAASTASGSTMSTGSMSSGSMTTMTTVTDSTTMTGSSSSQTGSSTTGSSTTGSKTSATTTASPSATKNAAVGRTVGAGAGLLAMAAGVVAVL
ncbi:hypothetical protein MMC30_003353 [Trapelia coarctata]|nr:hypothetical protein [Trapelia coarctata]